MVSIHFPLEVMFFETEPGYDTLACSCVISGISMEGFRPSFEHLFYSFQRSKQRKAKENRGKIRFSYFSLVFIVFHLVFLCFSLDFHKGRISQHIIHISLNPPKIIPFWILSVVDKFLYVSHREAKREQQVPPKQFEF